MRFLAQCFLIVATLAAPWMLAGAHEWTQVYLFGGVWLALLCAVPVVVFGRAVQPLPLVFWVLLAAVAWSGLQLIPLPVSWVELLSPNAVQLRQALLGYQPAGVPLSLRPEATLYDFRLLVMGVAAMFLAWMLFRTQRALVVLLVLLSLNGTTMAFFGLIQKLMWNGRLYWIGPEVSGSPFAAFVNRNSGGGYLNLCLTAALALIVWLVVRSGQRDGSSGRQATRTVWSSINGPQIVMWVFAVCMAGGVLSSLSRGAGISLFVGGVVAAIGLIATRREAGNAAWLILLIVAGIGLLSWSGLTEAWQARFDKLRDPQIIEGGRLPNWQDAARSVPDFWLTGSGLRTYRDIYLLYQNRYTTHWHHYAENQFLQALIEAGIIGLALLLLVLGLVGWAAVRLVRDSARDGSFEYRKRAPGPDGPHETAPFTASTALRFGLGVGMLFALATQVVHGCFDFGLYMPANMLLMAVLSGVTVGFASFQDGQAATRPWMHRAAAAVLLLTLLGLGAWGWLDLQTLVSAKAATNEVDFTQIPGAASAEQLDEAIASLSVHAERRPADAELLYQLAKLYVHRYRVALLPRLRQRAPATVSIDELWEQTSTNALHALVHLERDDADERALAQEFLAPARRHLLAARSAAPLLAKVHLRLARLTPVFSGRNSDVSHLQRARRCEPSNPYVLSRVGLLHLQAGRNAAAYEAWRNGLNLTNDRLGEIFSWCEGRIPDEDFVEKILPTDPLLLAGIADGALRVPGREALFELALARAKALAETEASEALQLYQLGRIAAVEGEYQLAIRHCAIAVQLRPEALDWRFELALMLEKQGMLDYARRQALICLRREPRNEKFKSLAQRLRLP